MSQFRIRDVTSEQRRRAFDLAKQEVGVQMVPDANLTPMALFLMAAIADQCIGIAVRQEVATITPPEPDASPDLQDLGLA